MNNCLYDGILVAVKFLSTSHVLFSAFAPLYQHTLFGDDQVRHRKLSPKECVKQQTSTKTKIIFIKWNFFNKLHRNGYQEHNKLTEKYTLILMYSFAIDACKSCRFPPWKCFTLAQHASNAPHFQTIRSTFLSGEWRVDTSANNVSEKTFCQNIHTRLASWHICVNCAKRQREYIDGN